MTIALLVLLNAQFAILIGAYALPEKRDATKSRDLRRQYEEDQLVYEDLLARVHMRGGRKPILASGRGEQSSAHDHDGEQVSEGSHSHLLAGLRHG